MPAEIQLFETRQDNLIPGVRVLTGVSVITLKKQESAEIMRIGRLMLQGEKNGGSLPTKYHCPRNSNSAHNGIQQ